MDSSASSRANMPPASSWTLEGDGKLLEYMESIAKNLENRSNQTIKDMNSMMLSVDVAAVDLDNAANRLQRLQQTQFIENRVQEEDVTMTEINDTKEKSTEKILSDVEATKVVMNDSLAMLGKCYKKISLEDEEDDDDSDDESLKHIYKPINPYDKRTPYIICTKEWLEKWHIGLKDDSDNEDNNEPDVNDEDSTSDIASQEHISSTIIKSDFDDDISSQSEQDLSPPPIPEIKQVHVPDMSKVLPEILNANRGHLVLPVAPTKEPTPPKTNQKEPSFFRNQTTTSNIPTHYTQNFFDDEPPELDNISVRSNTRTAPNLFTESDDENENFIKATPDKQPINPITAVISTPNNSNLFNDDIKPLDEPDRISNVVTPKITQVDKIIDNKNTISTSKPLLNTSKVSNLFESDSDDDEDYFDIIRKSNKKSAEKAPAGTMSVNLVKEDSPKILESQEKLTKEEAKSVSPKTPQNVQPKKENSQIVASVPKKASNLFEDSDEEDDFFSIKPKSAISKTNVTPQVISEQKKVEKIPEIPQKITKSESISDTKKSDSVVQETKSLEAPPATEVRTVTESPIKEESEKEVPKTTVSEEKVPSKSENTPKNPESNLFGTSDDESDFIPSSVVKTPIETKKERPLIAKKPVVSEPVQILKEVIPDEKPEKSPKMSPPTDLPFESVSIPPEDTSSELFSPQSDQFFTPNTTTTATPITPVYRSFIDELPPDDDFSGSYDTNEFDDPDDSDNFEQKNISTAVDPFLFNEEPPELINDDISHATPVKNEIVSHEKEITKEKEPEKSPGSLKNKFKMFETTNEAPPKLEKPKLEKPAPKKLNVNLNINVSALLPGAKRPSPKMPEPEPESVEEVSTPVKTDISSEMVSESTNLTPKKVVNQETTETQPNLLVSLNKNRIRAPTTRKPSTRKARVQSYHESTQKGLGSEFDNDDKAVKTDVPGKIPPISVADMLRTAKLKDQLSRRSLNFDEVDELKVPPKKLSDEKPLRVSGDTPKKDIDKPPVKEPEKPLSNPLDEKFVPTEVTSKVSPNRKPILFDDEDDPFLVPGNAPVSEIFKKVQIKPVDKVKPTNTVREKPKSKVSVFESDSDDDLFSTKTSFKSSKPVLEKEIFITEPPKQPEVAKKVTPAPPLSKIPKLFDESEDDDDLFTSKPSNKKPVKLEPETTVRTSTNKGPDTSVKPTQKSKQSNKSKSLFGSDDEDDNLFGGGDTTKKVTLKASKAGSSLFGEDSDDDSLFGAGASKGKKSKVDLIKPKPGTQAGAIKKTTSVVNDPLADLFK